MTTWAGVERAATLTHESAMVYLGDCVEVLAEFPDASVDAIVTDPPYGLEFMGKEWDRFDARTGRGSRVAQERATEMTPTGGGHSTSRGPYLAARIDSVRIAGAPYQRWCETWATECLRVLKPGGHLLAFGGTRTYHRLACAIEDAGFEIRDSISWLYGSGFPKSLDVAKAIDRAAGVEREVIGPNPADHAASASQLYHRNGHVEHGYRPDGEAYPGEGEVPMLTAPATAEAKRWAGWGTALKPAHEPIVVARKPLSGTVAQCVTRYGTGGLNIDATRVGEADGHGGGAKATSGFVDGYEHDGFTASTTGRWPPNVVLDDSQAALLDQESGELRARGNLTPTKTGATSWWGAESESVDPGDTGGASRFFPTFRYEAKAPSAERPSYVQEGAADPRVGGNFAGGIRVCNVCGSRTKPPGVPSDDQWPACGHDDWEWGTPKPREDAVSHPTVKPVDLMRWLVRLVTPPGGVCLDPFAGSGATLEAAIDEGFYAIGIEREPTYLPLIQARFDRLIPRLFFVGDL